MPLPRSQPDDATAEKLTRVALDEGYRNFFASVLAGNQRGFAKAVAASSVARSDLFICGSVVSNRADTFSRAYELTKRGCQQNVEAFAAVYLPTGQLWHSSKLRLVLNLPVGHGLCSWAATSAK